MIDHLKTIFQTSNRFAGYRKKRNRSRHGITLVELMIAVAITVIILAILLRIFADSSAEISKARATLEMAAQMRSAGETLRTDLQNVTVPLRPASLDSSANGYFEYIEGPDTDRFENVGGVSVDLAPNMNTAAVAGASYLGDHDDILAMTVRSNTRPFRGRFVNAAGMTVTIESYVAEVIWWTVHNDVNGNGDVDLFEDLTLYRRVLLIRPDLTTTDTDIAMFYQDNDVSVQPNRSGGGPVVMNTLEDLTKRENRFAHNGNIVAFPHEMMRGVLNNRPLGSVNAANPAKGSDVMLTNVAAFDVKILSPNAAISESNEQIIEPSDPGFAGGVADLGAYVDLGFTGPAATWFSGGPNLNSQLDGIAGLGNTWCTWSPHYEYDGINQDPGDDSIVDQGTDGLDNDGSNGVDDHFERETQPPYEHPIRSMQVSFRLIEKKTAQSRQLTIRQSFVPE